MSKLDILSDEALVDLYKERVTEAEAVLYNRHFDKVYRQCQSMLKDADDAFNVAQDALIKAFAKIDSFQGNSRFSTWVYAIALNECLQFIRHRNSEHRTSLPNVQEVADEPSDIAVRQQREERELIFASLVDQLSEDEKQLIKMKYWQKASVREIRTAFHLPTDSAVKMRLQRSRQKLERLYQRQNQAMVNY